MIRTAIYIRYSSENQRDGLSIEYQRAECTAFAEREGYTIVQEYVDEAITGTSTADRNAFFQMISDTKKGLYDIVLVYKFSRFARNLQEAEIFYNQIRKHGARLISVKEPIDDTRPEGTLMRQMLHSMDEYYSANLSTFVRSSMYTAAKKGKYLGGTLPFGLLVDDDNNFIENKEEADKVRRVFELRAAGAMPSDILRLFRSEGITSRNGKPFTQQLINKILRSEKYIGTYKYTVQGYEPIVIENAFAPIVDKETWDKVQMQIDETVRKRGTKGRRRKFVYALTGKIVCACCGEPYTGNSRGNGFKYYTCRGMDKLQICDNGSVEKDELEDYVFGKIKELILSEHLIDEMAQKVFENMSEQESKTDLHEDIRALKKERHDLERKLEDLLDLKLDGKISKELLNKKSNEVEERLTLIDSSIKSKEFAASQTVTIADIRRFLADMVKRLENADDDVKKAVASQFIDKIIIDKHSITVRLTVSPFFIGDKLNDGWALFTLSPERKRNVHSYSVLNI